MPDKKRCVTYIRVSTEIQVDGFSLDGQKRVINNYAKLQDIVIVKEYEDAGKSGKSIEGRPAFKEMLSDIEKGLKIDYVLVFKLSRFGRNAADVLVSLERIKRYGVNLISVEEGIDSSKTSGKLLISVLSAVSEIERENILEQTMNGRKEKARQGLWNGGMAPYGYQVNKNGLLEVVPEEAEVVKQIFDMYLNDNMGSRAIAEKLNAQGLFKTTIKGNIKPHWADTSILRILRNPTYTGQIAYGRIKQEKSYRNNKIKVIRTKRDNYILVPGRHEAIISKEIFDSVNAKLNAKVASYEKIAQNNLLTGLIVCPICGTKLCSAHSITTINMTPTKRLYYLCPRHQNSMRKVCSFSRGIPSLLIEPSIIEFMKLIIGDKSFIASITDKLSADNGVSKVNDEIENYNKKLSGINKAKSRLENEIDTLPLSTKNYDLIVSDLNRRLYKLYDQVGEILDLIERAKNKLNILNNQKISIEKVVEIINKFDILFELMTIEERKILLSYLINKIEIYEDFNYDKFVKSIELKFIISFDEVKITDKASLINMINSNQSDEAVYYKIEITDTLNKKIIGSIKDRYNPSKNKKRGPYAKVTYAKIKSYVLDKYNLKVSTLNIAQVKRSLNIEMYDAPNKVEVLKKPQPKCPEIKYNAILDALKYFKMIT